jgi:beta-aspartyl-peptidase (threonine type)
MKIRELVGTAAEASEAEKHGTVGAVACDAQGHLAAATSTGGYTNKPTGRVGDSPIIGAGTYARDGRCAVSGTGKGEYFIRYCVGHEIASLIAYKGLSLEQATQQVLGELSASKVGAGLVAVGSDGAIVAPYNTEGMYRGWVTPDGLLHVATHGDVEMAGQA